MNANANQSNPNVVSKFEYSEHVDKVDLEFNYVRLAVGRLSTSAKNVFFKELSARKQDKISKLLDPHLQKLPQELADKTRRGVVIGIGKNFNPRNRRPHFELIQDGINASELLIRVALFEAFMKKIHGAILHAKPSLLAIIHPDKQVKFQQLFGMGDFEKVRDEKIGDEVDELDRQKFLKRVKYFKAKLGVTMGTKEDLKRVSESIELRNTISHENPFLPVDPKLLAATADVLRRVPEACCDDARVLYPSHFSKI